tara:strand:+ start:93 stop:629 length:537 start_codon:yes stop_codon:yes gene_type:complete
MSNFVINPYSFGGEEVTWENLTTGGSKPTRQIIINDNFAYAQTVDSSIVNAGNITNVQFNLLAGNSSGTIHCCRWDDVATMNVSSGASCLAAANHTYWSIDADSPSGMTDETVSASTACVADETIGVVVTGGGDNQITLLRVIDPRIAGFEKLIHCDTATASQDLDLTATFTVTAAGS